MKKLTLKEFDVFSRKYMDFPVKKQLKPAKVLNTKISDLKNCSDSIASKLKEIFAITKVKDLIPWAESKSLVQLKEAAKKIGTSPVLWNEWVVLARLAKELPTISTSKGLKIKLLFAGLDRAGKTSLINFYIENQDSEVAQNTKPTRGATTTIKTGQNSVISIWELGGQMSYREEYIKHPARFFTDSFLLVFTIDLQSPKRFSQSCLYLLKILDILKQFKSDCKLLLLFHKADPDFQNDVKFLQNIQKGEKTFLPQLEKRNTNYSIKTSSIFSKSARLTDLFDDFVDVDHLPLANEGKSRLKRGVESLFKIFANFKRSTKEIDKDDKIKTPDSQEKNQIITDSESRLAYYYQIMQSAIFKQLVQDRQFRETTYILDQFSASWTKYSTSGTSQI